MASYTDDFNRPDSTSIGNWTESGDDWSIISSQLAPGVATLGLVVYASQLDTISHYAEIVMSVATAGSMGVFARSDIVGNSFYLWRNDGATWTLFQNLNGTFTSIGDYAAAAADGDVARIECNGSTISAYVNGVQRVSATDTGITTGQYVGLRSTDSATTRYDNFAAADLSGPPVDPDPGDFFQFI